MYYLLRHSSERCCISCIGIGWSGPVPSLLQIYYSGGSKILHLYKIGSLTATESVDILSAFSVFFISPCRPTGSIQLEGGKILRVGLHTWRLVCSGTVCWLAGRQTTTLTNRKEEHTGMRVAALLPADIGLGHGESHIGGSLWRNLREDLWSSLAVLLWLGTVEARQ